MNASVSNRPGKRMFYLRHVKVLLMAALAALAFTGSVCHDGGANIQSPRIVGVSIPEKDSGADTLSDHYDEETLVGSWKLTELSVTKNSGRPGVTDYATKNIIYQFQKNNKLTVSGKVDDIFVFDDFKKGEHYYEYQKPKTCARCAPAENLLINRPPPGPNGRYHIILYNDRTMRIIEEQKIIGGTPNDAGVITGGDTYTWEKTFVKLK